MPHPDKARHVCAPAPGIGPAWDVDAAFQAHRPLKIPSNDAEAIRDRIVEAARRLPEFMDRREVARKDRVFLQSAFPKGIAFKA